MSGAEIVFAGLQVWPLRVVELVAEPPAEFVEVRDQIAVPARRLLGTPDGVSQA